MIKTANYTVALLMGLALSTSAIATNFEVTPYIGHMFSGDLQSSTDNTSLSVSDDSNFGISFAWQDNANGQGMILLNFVSHDYISDFDQQNHDLDIIYAHFNGVAQFRQQSYVTTVSLGVGGAYFDAEGGESLTPSLTAALGTRYEFANNLALVTEIRTYASLIKKDDDMLCLADGCSAQFDGPIWVETSLSFGISYQF